jgi:hypothetical protein
MNITNAMLDEYSNERIEVDDRPVLIDPGIYKGQLVDWEKSFNPMFRKYSLVMNFRIDGNVVPGWFNIEPSESKTTVKAGWKSNFLRMYQGCLDIRLDRRDRISLAHFNNKPMMLEVVSIERDSDHKEMAQVNHYSRVKKILKVIDED